MAKRGRKETPAELKILRATRKDRLPAAAAKAPEGLPTMPAFLDDDEDGKAEWARMVKLLAPGKALSPIDGPALGNYCRLYSTALKAQAEIAANGVLSETALGGDKANPAVQMLISATGQMTRLLVEFRMTPAARSASAGREPAKDELGEFLSKKA